MDENKQINIGYIVNSSKIGGANRSMEGLSKGLRGSRFVPYFVCPSPGPMVELVQSLGVPVEVYELYQPSWREPIQTYRHWREWSAFIASNHISLIHANNLHGGRSAVLATYTHKIPLLCHIRFLVGEEYCQWAFQRLPKPFGFIFNSQAIRKEVGPFLEQVCPTSRQWVVYNGVDIHTFTSELVANTTPRIGIVGNLQTVKGHEDFLEMAALLVKKGREARYDIIGGETQEQGRLKTLQTHAEKLGITNYVYFHGYVERVAELVKQLDIIVCSSHFESFGRCLIEGMACGKPVVATRVGGILEVVEDQKTGILVPPHNPQALAEAVAKLLDNEKMRNMVGEQGRVRVEQLFSMEAHIAAILKIYHEVLNI